MKDNNRSTTDGVDFIKINPEVFDADNWFKSRKIELQDKVIRLYHAFFGYRKDPGRVGKERILIPLTVQLASSHPTPRKTFNP